MKSLLSTEEYVRGAISLAVVTAVVGSIIALNEGGVSYWLQFWWLFPVAFGMALLVNTIGISGAALFVPFFILIFPLVADPLTNLESVKVGLMTESFGLLSSAIAFVVFGLVDFRIALRTIATALPFLVGGVLLASFIPEVVLLLMIAGLLLVSFLFLVFEERFLEHREKEQSDGPVDWRHSNGTAVEKQSKDGTVYHYCRSMAGYMKRFTGYSVGAFFQGAVGFGIGELGIISMLFSHIPIRIAIGTSHVVVSATAIIASVIHVIMAAHGAGEGGEDFPWNIVVMTIPAGVIAGQISPYVASKLPTKALERVMAGLFFGIAAALVGLAVS